MAKKTWWQLPYVGLALLSALVWGAGSTYWYVCKTEILCEKRHDAVQAPSAVPEAVKDSPAEVTMAKKPDIIKVFFLPDSTEKVDEVDLSTIAEYAKANPTSKIKVVGYYADVAATEVVGDLSQQRADVVKAQLTSLGIADNRISVEAKGADKTAAGDDEAVLANGRRVEVSIN
jgi:outer membrane protein OmpA-like peptidoglycan-associated protein